MGRKRNQGKARRAAKAKAREEAERRGDDYQPGNSSGQSLLSAQIIQQVQAGGANTTCKHGLDSLPSTEAIRFLGAFQSSLVDFLRCGKRVLWECLLDAKDATMDEFANVWHDIAKLEIAMSVCLSMGTKHFLGGYYDNARNCATYVRFFEQHIAFQLKQTQALINWPKIHETHEADIHTLVKFFRHRILCSCLDEKYEEVKHITKMGCCYNPQCSLPNKRVERSKAKYCSRCRCATYCSRECQVADWSRHKSDCDEEVSIIAEFVAKQLVAKQQNI